MMRVYVATSWRNERQSGVVEAVRNAGHEVYDFRNPKPGDHGFHWSEIDPDWQTWSPAEYRAALNHPRAVDGFASDMDALTAADAVVLVGPCGRSAHIEAAYAAGVGKLVMVLLADGEPELMYKIFDHLCLSIEEVCNLLALADTREIQRRMSGNA